MRLVDVLLTAAMNRPETPTRKAIAAACRELPGGDGFGPEVLSAYLAYDESDPNTKGRPISPRHLAVLAAVLKGNPSTLMEDVDDRDIIGAAEAFAKSGAEAAQPAPIAPITTPAGDGSVREVTHANAEKGVRPMYALPDREPDYTLAEKNGLIPIRSIEDAEGLSGIPIWDEAVAATSWASNDPTGDVSIAWVPSDVWKMHGAELRAITVAGRSMERAGINPGDTLFVRQTSDVKRAQDDIVIAACEEGMTVKRLRGRVLVAETNLDITPKPLGKGAKLKGVVVGIHKPIKK